MLPAVGCAAGMAWNFVGFIAPAIIMRLNAIMLAPWAANYLLVLTKQACSPLCIIVRWPVSLMKELPNLTARLSWSLFAAWRLHSSLRRRGHWHDRIGSNWLCILRLLIGYHWHDWIGSNCPLSVLRLVFGYHSFELKSKVKDDKTGNQWTCLHVKIIPSHNGLHILLATYLLCLTNEYYFSLSLFSCYR